SAIGSTMVSVVTFMVDGGCHMVRGGLLQRRAVAGIAHAHGHGRTRVNRQPEGEENQQPCTEPCAHGLRLTRESTESKVLGRCKETGLGQRSSSKVVVFQVGRLAAWKIDPHQGRSS